VESRKLILVFRLRDFLESSLTFHLRLRGCFCRIDIGGGGVYLETEEPVAGDVAAVEFGGGEFPELGGF